VNAQRENMIANHAGYSWVARHQMRVFVSAIYFHIFAHKNGLYFYLRGQSLFTEVKTVVNTWLIVLGALLTIVF
jgi:putative colanic acid biosynthesis UDP-glucose lipid carrier transferase